MAAQHGFASQKRPLENGLQALPPPKLANRGILVLPPGEAARVGEVLQPPTPPPATIARTGVFVPPPGASGHAGVFVPPPSEVARAGASSSPPADVVRASSFVPPFEELARGFASAPISGWRSVLRNDDEAGRFQNALQSWNVEADGGNWLTTTARGWQCVDDIQRKVKEIPTAHGLLLRDAFKTVGATSGPERLDMQLAQRLYRQSYYFAHYLYLSLHPGYDPAMVKNQWGDLPKVLMVAEKPSIAKTVAEHLSGGRLRTRKGISRACQTYEFVTRFPKIDQKCQFITTSVIGHVFGMSFEKQKGVRPEQLYRTKVVKEVEETSHKNRVVEHLKDLATDCKYLVLWLDCDREGENICYEVIGCVREQFRNDDNVYRAQFSAITEQAIKQAFSTLGRPNKHMSMAVDARQELDLKIGVSFTKLLTRSFLEKAKVKFPRMADDLRVLSYGPCQTPTLWFCAQRHNEIQQFRAQSYWSPTADVDVGSPGGSLKFKWHGEKVYNEAEGHRIISLCRRGVAIVVRYESTRKTAARPHGLNTVAMLKAGSTGLGISPGTLMKIAESLYSHGFISYPRTESSRYPQSMDMMAILRELDGPGQFGSAVSHLLQTGHVPPPHEGHDAGDHPPITPVRAAGKDDFTKHKEWRLYEFVTKHFLASLSPNVDYVEHRIDIDVSGERFFTTWHEILDRGFLRVTPWRENQLGIHELNNRGSCHAWAQHLHSGRQLRITGDQLAHESTKPPEYLKESELIGLMDRNGIGTDASMATHIENVVARQYCVVCEASDVPGKPGPRIKEGKGKGKGGPSKSSDPQKPKSRHMVPTSLGLAVLEMFQRLIPDVCEPRVRAFMEKQVAQISDGIASQDKVVAENLDFFLGRFRSFQQNLPQVEHIFDVKDGEDTWDIPDYDNYSKKSNKNAKGSKITKKQRMLVVAKGKLKTSVKESRDGRRKQLALLPPQPSPVAGHPPHGYPHHAMHPPHPHPHYQPQHYPGAHSAHLPPFGHPGASYAPPPAHAQPSASHSQPYGPYYPPSAGHPPQGAPMPISGHYPAAGHPPPSHQQSSAPLQQGYSMPMVGHHQAVSHLPPNYPPQVSHHLPVSHQQPGYPPHASHPPAHYAVDTRGYAPPTGYAQPGYSTAPAQTHPQYPGYYRYTLDAGQEQ